MFCKQYVVRLHVHLCNALQDVGGDEDWHLNVQAVGSSGPSRDLTPFKVMQQQQLRLHQQQQQQSYSA
jgi:hypothetical protein